ncbi:FUSC family protein [Legionella sp. km772]|uniref:FUSC family protein n=1 Tax=Legionella sp. km772 TaxID=2498111 RepID=UPI000F8C6C36|nr:FUSC family protein [Legionella sp. km772]RUR07718.1 FUSC family protein [Legionella sp. km772]
MFPYWPRTVENRAALRTAIAALSAVLVAFTFHLPSPYWSGMSVVIISNLYTGSIIDKALMRIIGTIIGAALGFYLVGIVANSFLLYLLSCFLIIAVSVYFYYYSRYGYAYLLGALCAFIIISQITINPQNAFNVAIWRPIEIAVGVVVFALCVYVFFPNHLKDNITSQVSDLFNSYIQEFKKLAVCIANNEIKVAELSDNNLKIKKKLRKATELIVSLNVELGTNQAQTDRLRAFLDTFFTLARQIQYVIALPYIAADLQLLQAASIDKLFLAITDDLQQIHRAFITAQTIELSLKSKLALTEFEEQIKKEAILARSDFIYAFIVFFNQVIQHLSFLHSLLGQTPIAQEKPYVLLTRKDRIKTDDKELIKHAIKAGLSVLLALGFWLVSNWPGGINGIISSLVISMRLNLLEMKNVIIHRLLGCSLGGGLALVSLAVVEMNLYDFIVLLFFAVWGFSYFMFKFPKYAYIGLQANIALIITLAQEGGPPTLLDPPLQRLAGVVIGIAASFIVANILWRSDVWTLLQRYLEKIYNYLTFNLRQALLITEKKTIYDLASIFWLARGLIEGLSDLDLKKKKLTKLTAFRQRFESLVMTQATISYILTSIDKDKALSIANQLELDLLPYEQELVFLYENNAYVQALPLYEQLNQCIEKIQSHPLYLTIEFSDLRNLLAYLNALKQLCLRIINNQIDSSKDRIGNPLTT